MSLSTTSTLSTDPSYWTPTRDLEAKKTAAKEDDWNLAGARAPPETRTRSGGERRRPVYNFFGCDEDDDNSSVTTTSEFSWLSDLEESDEESDEEEPLESFVKPSNSRVILEVDPLLDLMERNATCKMCSGHIKVDIKTTCLASSMKLLCLDDTCGYIDYSSPPAAADVRAGGARVGGDGFGGDGSDNRERSTDYAINVAYVLVFLSCGDGGKEAARLLGMLGLPNDTTMESRSFPIIEDRIGVVIREFNCELLLENLTEEVRLSMEDSADYDANDFLL